MSSNKLVVSILALLNLGIIPFLLNFELGYLSYLLLFILLLSLGFFIPFLFKKSNASISDILTKTDVTFLLILLVLSCLVGLRSLNLYSIWLDEYEEGRNVLYYSDILQRAADYQQPPLGYFLRKIGLLAFGKTEFGLRSASLGGFILNVIVMYLTVKKVTRDAWFSFFSALFLAFNIILISYSVEARPYSISLMFCSFLFYALADYLFPYQDGSRLPSYFLIFIVFYWLMSISMQPLFFMLLLLVFTFVIWLVKRQKKFLYLSAFSIMALVLFAPFALNVLEKSTGYLKEEMVLHKFNEHFIYEISNVFIRLFYNNEFHRVIACQILAIMGLSLFYSKQRTSLVVIFLFAFCYVIAICSFMKLKVNWAAHYRYYITSIPLFYLIFFTAFYSVLDGKYMKIKNFCLGIMAMTIIYSYSQAEPLKYFYHDWRGLYSFLEKTSVGKSKALIFAYPAKGNWVNDYFLASEYYPTEKVEIKSMRKFKYPEFTTYDELYETLNKKKEGEFFFVIMASTLSSETFEKISIAGVEKFALRDFYIFHSQKNAGLTSFAKEYFKAVNLAGPFDNIFVRTFDGLFLVSIAENDCKSAANYLKVWTPIAKEFDERLLLRIQHHNQLQAEICPN